MPLETEDLLLVVEPVRTVLSGPATGVVGGLEVGLAAGFRHLITFDMGGTSTDVSLIADGVSSETVARDAYGLRERA